MLANKDEEFTRPLPKHPNRFQWLVHDVDKEIYEEYGIRFAFEKYARYLSLDSFYTLESIVIAALIAACGFRRRKDTQFFLSGLWYHSWLLNRKFHKGKFKPGFYKKRQINERGKPRDIKPPQFECKVMQKVVSNLLLRPTLEHEMIYHNNASVCARGIDKTYEDVLNNLNRALKAYGGDGVIVLADFSGYFASIDRKGRLRNRYLELFKDPAVADFLIAFDKGEEGLTLGNETSQIPASAFPSPIDHYFKDKMHLRFYVRYMDDACAILANNDEADRFTVLYRYQAAKQGLVTTKMVDGKMIDKIKKIPLGQSFTFCKERFVYSEESGQYYRLPNPQKVRNIKHKIKVYERLVIESKIEKEEAERNLYAMIKGLSMRPGAREVTKGLLQMAADHGFTLKQIPGYEPVTARPPEDKDIVFETDCKH